MTKRVVVGMLLAVMAVLPLACEVEQEVEDTDVTPTLSAAASPTAQATSTAQAEPTLPPLAAEQERLRQEEAAKPKFEGVVNGIHIYPTDAPAAARRKDACSDAKASEVREISLDAVAGTPMEITPTYLPAGAEEVAPFSAPLACGGTVVYVERQWSVRNRDANFFVIRRQGEQAIGEDASAGRISAATVGGKRAVLVEPLTPAGYGYSGVIVAEDFGLTTVTAFGLALEETVKIAEGLIA